jgi:predicted RNase H-like nuclease (RuvC/YqgF family)
MSELTQPVIEQPVTNELEVLRRTNGELVAKSATRKARVTELEATVTELQSKLAAASDTIRQVTVDGPVRTMAESMSQVPELFLEQFNKSYRVELLGGKLTLLSAIDRKPVEKDGKTVPFERQALAQHLTSGDGATAKVFRAITTVSRATGGRIMPTTRTPPQSPKINFGLR